MKPAGKQQREERKETIDGLAELTEKLNTMLNLAGGLIEGLIDRSDRQAAHATEREERLRTRYIELLEANLKLVRNDRWSSFVFEFMNVVVLHNTTKGLEMLWIVVAELIRHLAKNPSSVNQ